MCVAFLHTFPRLEYCGVFSASDQLCDDTVSLRFCLKLVGHSLALLLAQPFSDSVFEPLTSAFQPVGQSRRKHALVKIEVRKEESRCIWENLKASQKHFISLFLHLHVFNWGQGSDGDGLLLYW